jgi:hypothetical protein
MYVNLNGLRANIYELIEIYLFVCSQGPHRAVNSDRDLAHSHNLYNLHFVVRYKNTVFAGCRVHQTDRAGENTVFFQCF